MRQIIAFLFAAFVAAPVFADHVRINAGFWPGDLDPELETRMFKDDILAGPNFGRLDLDWTGKDTYTLYPLGLQYFKDGIGPGTLVISANYIRYTPDYKFTALGTAPSISFVNLENFKNSDWEAQLGYQIPVLDKKLILTPEFGGRWHFQEFNYDELTIGNGTFAKSFDSPFRANAKGSFIGAGAQYYVTPQLSILADYIRTTPFFGNVSGSMSDKRNVAGVSSGGAYLQIDRATAGYVVDISRWTLGVQYDITPELHLQAGVREETQTAQYTGYFNIPILVTNGIAGPTAIPYNTAVEIVTDKLFWESKEVQTKGLFFVAASYDLNL